MDRRRFLGNLAAGAAALNVFPPLHADAPRAQTHSSRPSLKAADVSIDGHTLLCTFARNGETWKAYEDLSTRHGNLTLVSSSGIARVLRKTAEPTFAESGPP